MSENPGKPKNRKPIRFAMRVLVAIGMIVAIGGAVKIGSPWLAVGLAVFLVISLLTWALQWFVDQVEGPKSESSGADTDAEPANPAAEQAKILLEAMQEYQKPAYEHRVVDGSTFTHLSQKFYRRTQSKLEDLGFVPLGDMQNLTMETVETAWTRPRTFIRVMANHDRTILAGFYHVKPQLIGRIAMLVLRLPSKIIEFQSETSTGYNYTTTMVPKSVNPPHPDTMKADIAPRMSSVRELYERHVQNLAERQDGGELIRMHRIEDVMESENRQAKQNYDHLETIGWVTKEYIRTQGVSERMVDDVYDEIQRMLGRSSPPERIPIDPDEDSDNPYQSPRF